MSAIELLSAKYNFNIEDAINVLNENKTKSKSKSKVVEAKKEVEDLFAQIVNDVDDVIINNTDNSEVVMKDQAMMNSDDYNNDLQILINSIEKYPIALPEKMPAEYDGMSVKDAYLMARVKKEKEMKPAEKQLIRAVIKGANKYQKEVEKAEKEAAKKAEKQALAEQKKKELAEKKAAEKAADPKEIEKQKKAAEKKAAAELKKLEQEEAKKAKMVEKAKKEMEKKMTPEKMKKEQEKMNKELEKQKKAAEKEIEKEKKEAEKKAAKEAKEAEKLAKKKEPKAKAAKAVETKVEAKVEEAPVKVTVKRVKIAGQEYLKSSANILYNPETQEEVGMYDEVTNSIKPLPDDEEEELSEDNYDN
jgi:hypothetical protein